MIQRFGAAALGLGLFAATSLAGTSEPLPPAPADAGAPGAAGLALLSSKVVTCALDGPQVIDHGIVLVKDGKIEAVGTEGELEIPEGYEPFDVGDNWIVPGLVELHNHIGTGLGIFVNDFNDSVYLTNPGMRASAGVRPNNGLMRRGVAGGVTTALYIPGSGSNIGGAGVLLKLGLDTYEASEVRNPGSMKLAQAGNPEGWTVGVTRTFMNWNTRNTLRRGTAYAKRWEAFENGNGPKPEKDVQWEVFRDLHSKKTQVSVHTQAYQVVLMTITMVRREFGFDTFIDHGSFDGYRTAALAEEAGVHAILGPRGIQVTFQGRIDTDGQMVGIAAKYQEGGHTSIGFNTDCVDNGVFVTPPQEELCLQAAVAMRYGLDNSNLEGIRGLTIVPAIAAGLEHRVGSIEAGKDADLVVISGDIADPRSAVSKVYTEGHVVYDSATERRLW